MLTFLEFIAEDARIDTIRNVNIKNRIAGVKRVKKSVDLDAGDPSKLNFPKNTPVGSMPKPKIKSIPSGTGIGKSNTPVSSIPKIKPSSIPSGTGIGRSNTPVGSMPKAKTNTIPSGTGIGRSNTPVGSMPKAKTNTIPYRDRDTIRNVNIGNRIAGIKRSVDLEAGDPSKLNFPKNSVGQIVEPVKPTKKSIPSKFPNMPVFKAYTPRKSQPPETTVQFNRDTPEKLKKDAEQTWNIKAKEPKESGWKDKYVGGYVKDRNDISSPKETLRSYIDRRKKDTDKWFIPDKTKDFDLIAARGYDVAKDPKTGLPDVKTETDPKLWGSYMPSTGRIQVRKKPFRSKTTTTHEYGHVGQKHFDPEGKVMMHASREMARREMDARRNTDATADAKRWWNLLYKGEVPGTQGLVKLSAPLGDRDRISIERINDKQIDQSRKELSQKYFRGGRESHTDTDLKKAALGNTLPYANKKQFDKEIDSTTGNPNQLKFPRNSPISLKNAAIQQQKDYNKQGHYSPQGNVYKRSVDIGLPIRFTDYETGNPNQLNFPKGKK